MFKQITPAVGWYFVGQGVGGERIVFPLAAWGLTEDGKAVIGLVGDVLGGAGVGIGPTQNGAVRLVSVPPIPGMYRHETALSAEEMSAVMKR